MGFLFKTLQIYIYNLGLFAAAFFKAVFKAFLKFFGFIPKKLFPYIKKSFSSVSVFFRRTVAFVLIIAIIAGGAYYIFTTLGKVEAVALKLGDETLGYVETLSEAELTKTLVFNKVADGTKDIAVEETKVTPCDLKNPQDVSEIIIGRLSADYVKVCEIYIDNNLLCAVDNEEIARRVISERLEKAKQQYPAASVSFTQKISFNYAYYLPSDPRIWTEEKLRLTLSTLDILTVRHAECERSLATVEYDTVEIQTNTLFIGDSRVRREGTDGKEYVVDLVTYVGDKKVLSEKLMSVNVTPPVSRVIERGMRAGSLSMGSYTVMQTSGYFCWPVVDLNTITSEYGERSLGYHHGLDISGAGASGSLIVAGASGVVVEAGYSASGYGNYVQIDHGNGVETLYGHMLDNSIAVNVGDTVTKGQAIGRVGNTGYSFGAHLHFEVRINGNRVDPAPYLGL